MAAFRVFKRKSKRNGKTVESETYYGEYRVDGMPCRKTVNLGCTDKQVALSKLRKIVSEAEREAEGLLAPKSQRDAAQKPFPELVDEYLADLTALNSAPKYVRLVKTRILTLSKKCGWLHLRDITPESFTRWRSGQKATPKTLNDYLGAISAFLNWLVQSNRCEINPLAKVGKVAKQKMRFRRALDESEVLKLIQKGPYRLVYWVAVTTGLRAGEIKKLQWGDLHFQAEEAWFAVRGSTTKNRKDATQPIAQDLLKELLAVRPENFRANDSIFSSVPRNRRFRLDLKAVGIPYADDQGRVADFHSLRMTYATLLHNTGAAPRVVQELMRHSDPRLTNQTYTDATKLPIFKAASKIQLTGKVTEKVTDISVPEGQKPTQAGTSDDLKGAAQPTEKEGDSHSETQSDTTCQNEELVAGAGFEPAAFRL